MSQPKSSLSQPLIALLTLAMVSGIVSFCGCAGYQLGNQNLYRNDIQTVHVPIFESDSNRRFLGQRLTEAVVKQVEGDTSLTIANADVASSFLIGRILSEEKVAVAENRFDDVRVIRTGWEVELQWVDRAGMPLMPKQQVRIKHQDEFIPEGGQSMATAQQEVIERIAREIVGQLEMPW